MTPPKVDRVDIRPLDTLYLEHLYGVKLEELSPFIKNSDLFVGVGRETTKDAQGKIVEVGEPGLRRRLAENKSEPRSLEEDTAWVDLIRSLDTNGDHFLDLTEAKAALSANLAADQAATVDPQSFLNSINELITKRYGPISANFKRYAADSVFGPTMDAIRMYNRGINVDEVSEANRTFALNGLGKTATNIAMFLPSLAHNIWGDSPLLVGDAAAQSAAERKFWERSAAINKLQDVIDEGVRKNESWAMEGNLEAALQRLDSGTVAVLNEELCASKLHAILRTEDPKQRYAALLAFAEGERPGFLGYGGGNSHIAGGWWESWWNLSGRRNNIFFAKTLMRFLAVKAASNDPAFDQDLSQRSRGVMSDMNGDGGGYGNLAAVGLTNILCIGGALCEPTEYRDWSDEARMDGLGRGIDGALMVWGANKAFSVFGEANRLRSFKGIREVFRVWRQEGGMFRRAGAEATLAAEVANGADAAKIKVSRFRPFPISSWKREADIAAKEAELIGEEGKALGSKGKPGRLGRVVSVISNPFSSLANWAAKGLPRVASGIKTVGRVADKGFGKLLKGVMILGIVQYGDSKLSPAFNPFEYGMKDMNREADFDPYPDFSKPPANFGKK